MDTYSLYHRQACDGGQSPRKGGLGVRLPHRTGGGQFSDINSDLSVYYLQYTGYPLFPVRYMSPLLFAETVFVGFNSLIALRNEVVEQARPRVVGETYGALIEDSSPLCTVVHVDSQKIQHTCQSSKGGSGGALYQRVRDGRGNIVEEGIVAVNDGATTRGEVSENRGVAVLSHY